MTTYNVHNKSLIWKNNVGPAIAWWIVSIDAWVTKLPDGTYQNHTAQVRDAALKISRALDDPMRGVRALRQVGVWLHPAWLKPVIITLVRLRLHFVARLLLKIFSSL